LSSVEALLGTQYQEKRSVKGMLPETVHQVLDVVRRKIESRLQFTEQFLGFECHILKTPFQNLLKSRHRLPYHRDKFWEDGCAVRDEGSKRCGQSSRVRWRRREVGL
jgi:hypothetical protein